MSTVQWHQNVLTFWFEELTKKDWFISSAALDETITNRFADVHANVSNESDLPNEADSNWALAAIIVLDQFSRNMFRGTPQAFASDQLALRFSKQAIERDLQRSMSNDQQQFLYMPFMHSENLDDHKKSLKLFETLGHAEHAVEHMQLIERFGRFPHRNEILGRQSTPDELSYLEDGKRYGQ